jgi:hypothetical protein
MIRTSEAINELSDAFAKAQTKFGAAIKASQNPAFRSKYADLASVIDATLEHLNAEGIGVMQHPALEFKGEGDNREAFVTVTTRLQHKAGQWMESDVTIPAVQRDRFDAQSVGSAITYACRYALRSICTVPQADDDANEASGVGSHEAAQAVGRRKVEDAKAKASNGGKPSTQPVNALFYVEPPSQNGNLEFVNIREFLATREDLQDSLRMVFTTHKAKKTKDETALVPSGELQPLLEKLVGEMGLTVKKLESPRA